MQLTARSPKIMVSADGTGIVSQGGGLLLAQTLRATGLDRGLEAALERWRQPRAVHSPGKIITDLAVAVALGGDCLADVAMLRAQPELFGPVASDPVVSRLVARLAADAPRALKAIRAARAAARQRAWELAGDAAPGAGGGLVTVDIDATIVTSCSDKEQAMPTWKKTYGHHPLAVFADHGPEGSGEPLAVMLRAGNAGSNTAADHMQLLDEAIAALPPALRRNLMVTCDGAGASHELVKKLDQLASRRGYQVIYSVGWALTGREKAALALVPETAWEAAIDARGEVRERRADGACADPRCAHRACWIEEAHVTELTGLLRSGPGGDQLKAWPKTMRVFARRERPHPGAQLTLFEAEDGWRYSLWAANRPVTTRGWLGQCAYIDAAHRVHARVEDVIRTGKDTGLGHFPSHDYKVNQAWLDASMTACILLAWLRLLALDGDLAKAEPKTLRYRVLHAAARLVRGGRRRWLKIAASWPWAEAITAAWQRISALPQAP